MKNIITICKLNLTLMRKNFTLQGLCFILVIFSAIIFFLAKGLEHVNDEMQVRIEYSYSLVYYFLTFSILFISCFLVRNQIDIKTIQLLCSFPVKRIEVWFGKLLCLIVISFLALLTLIISIFSYSWIYLNTFSKNDQKKGKDFYSISRYESYPLQKNFLTLAAERLEGAIDRGEIKRSEINNKVWQNNLRATRQLYRTIKPNGSKEWEFQINENRIQSKHVLLRTKITTQDRRTAIPCTLSITNNNVKWEKNVTIYPFTETYIPIPVEYIPLNRPFRLKIKASNPKEIAFKENEHFALLYADGYLIKNIIKGLFFQLFHLTIISTLGLFAGTLLSFPVATFCTGTFFTLGTGIKFFGNELEIFTRANLQEHNFIENILWSVVQLGSLTSTCLNSPTVISKIARGLSVPFIKNCQSWLFITACYIIIINIIAILYIEKKELDKTGF